jgi:hypothetical protein
MTDQELARALESLIREGDGRHRDRARSAELARALESLIREDAKRPPEEQIRELIEAGVIDKEGRVLIGFWNKSKHGQNAAHPNGPGEEAAPQNTAGT